MPPSLLAADIYINQLGSAYRYPIPLFTQPQERKDRVLRLLAGTISPEHFRYGYSYLAHAAECSPYAPHTALRSLHVHFLSVFQARGHQEDVTRLLTDAGHLSSPSNTAAFLEHPQSEETPLAVSTPNSSG